MHTLHALKLSFQYWQNYPFDHEMPTIKSRSCKIFINWMNVKVFERINRSWAMLPNISNYIIKITCFKIIDRIRRKPILHINVTKLSMLSIQMILFRRDLIAKYSSSVGSLSFRPVLALFQLQNAVAYKLFTYTGQSTGKGITFDIVLRV